MRELVIIIIVTIIYLSGILLQQENIGLKLRSEDIFLILDKNEQIIDAGPLKTNPLHCMLLRRCELLRLLSLVSNSRFPEKKIIIQ